MKDLKRSAGILLPIFSLPSKYGIGDMGEDAKNFIDLLDHFGITLWQMLPFSLADNEGCPYSSNSAFGGNPLLIDPEQLLADNLINQNDIDSYNNLSTDYVNYPDVEESKNILFQKAFTNITKNKKLMKEFNNFLIKEDSWIHDLALFLVLTEQFGNTWSEWPQKYRNRDIDALKKFTILNKVQISFHQFLQYIFFKQWNLLKEYASLKNIKLVGDLPIFVKHHSMDVWRNPNNFKLDHNGNPYVHTGAPPDAFSSEGQNWGNPNYNWDTMRQQYFSWWINRMKFVLEHFDIVRLDHFRGFSATWEIPSETPDARTGSWSKVPGDQLFTCLKEHFSDLPLIAEDLGTITKDVHWLREKHAIPGMKVLQFAFGSGDSNTNLPHNFSENTVVYTGTHDNQTTNGWFHSLGDTLERDYAIKYTQAWNCENFHWSLIDLALKCHAKIAIIPLQDILGHHNEARINTPGKEDNNWKWRFSWDQINADHFNQLQDLLKQHHRMK